MKIKNKNELKGISEVTVSIPDELLEKYKNRQALGFNNTLLQLFGLPLNKFNKEIIDVDLKSFAISQIGPRVKEFLTEELLDDSDDFAFISNFITPTNDDENDIQVMVYSKPTVTYNYKDLEKPEPFQGLYDDEKEILIEKELKELQKNNARLTPLDRSFEEGDVISIITAFEDESIEDMKSQIIFPEQLDKYPTLKENLIGKSAEDVFSFKPSDSSSEVTIKVVQVYEADMDDLDDEFASEVSEFDTLDELKNFIVETEENKLKDQHETEIKNDVLLQFINSIEIADVDDSLIEFVQNPDIIDETNVGLFMEGFINKKPTNKSLTEYYDHLLNYIYDLILKEENIETDEIINTIIKNWDSGDFDDEYKKKLEVLKNYSTNLSQEEINQNISEIIKANKVKDVIYKYSLDSEN